MIRIFQKLIYTTICLFSCALYLSAQGAAANAPDFEPQATSTPTHLLVAQVSDSVRQPATHISTPYQGVLTTLSVSNMQVRSEWKVLGNKNFTLSIVNQRAELWVKGGSEDGFTPPQTIILTIQAIDKFSDLHTSYSDLISQATITVMIMPSALLFSPTSALTWFYGDLGAFLTVTTDGGAVHKTYHLTVADGAEYFGIDAEDGILTVHGLPPVKIYTLAVDVVDAANAKATATIMVTIKYAPLQLDTPPELLATVSMMASLHTFVARGGDLVYTYTILSGNDMGYFALDNAGVLSLTATTAAAQDRYTLSIEATDGRGIAVTVATSVRVRALPINMNRQEAGVTVVVEDLHYREEVKFLSAETMSHMDNLSMLATSYEDTALEFDASQSLAIDEGEVLALPNADGEWYYYRVVTGKKEENGKLIVDTRQAGLDDILEVGMVQIQTTLAVSNGNNVQQPGRRRLLAATADDYVDCSAYPQVIGNESFCGGYANRLSFNIIKRYGTPARVSFNVGQQGNMRALLASAGTQSFAEGVTLQYTIPPGIPLFLHMRIAGEVNLQGADVAGWGGNYRWRVGYNGTPSSDINFDVVSLPPDIASDAVAFDADLGAVVLFNLFAPPQIAGAGVSVAIRTQGQLAIDNNKYNDGECGFWEITGDYTSNIGVVESLADWLPSFTYSSENTLPITPIGQPCPRLVASDAVVKEHEAVAMSIILLNEVPQEDSLSLTLRIAGDVDDADYEITAMNGLVDCQTATVCALVIPQGQREMVVNLKLREDENDEADEELIVFLDGAIERFTLVISDASVCDRTPGIRSYILWYIRFKTGVYKNCEDVTKEDLGVVEGMHLHSYENRNPIGYRYVSSLKAGDFYGLTLANLYIESITNLPADVFDGLTITHDLRISNTKLMTLPVGIFRGLTPKSLGLGGIELTTLSVGVFDGLEFAEDGILSLSDNNLTTLPAGIFDGLSLGQINIAKNNLTSLPTGVFRGLTLGSREHYTGVLNLSENNLTTLPVGVFDGLKIIPQAIKNTYYNQYYAFGHLNLGNNNLTTLPAGVFRGLISIGISLVENNLTTLPVGVFSGVNGLRLDLNNNNLTSLPAGIFSGVGLETLNIGRNNLTSLPAGLLNGTNLWYLDIRNNPWNYHFYCIVHPKVSGPLLDYLGGVSYIYAIWGTWSYWRGECDEYIPDED